MEYDIHTSDDLVNVLGAYILKNQTKDKHFVIQEDIDCSALKNFAPLGNGSKYSFDGELDGKGHIVKNLTINPQQTYNLGLFSKIGINGKVKNLRLESINIEQNINDADLADTLTQAGMIAAICQGEIYGCSASGVITVQTKTDSCQVGGLCGSLPYTESKIGNSWADVKISFQSDSKETWEAGDNKNCIVGGIVGSVNGSITSCHSRSELFAPAEQTVCYSAGGICGTADSCAQVTSCYNIGYLHSRAVEGDALAGIAGTAHNDAKFEKCLYLKGCLLSKSFQEIAKASNTIGGEKSWEELTSSGTASSELGEDYMDTPSDAYQYTPGLIQFQTNQNEGFDSGYLKALCTPAVVSFTQSPYPGTANPVKIDCALSDCQITEVSLTANRLDGQWESFNPTVSDDSFCCDLENNKYVRYDFAVTLKDKYERTVTIWDVDIEMK